MKTTFSSRSRPQCQKSFFSKIAPLWVGGQEFWVRGKGAANPESTPGRGSKDLPFPSLGGESLLFPESIPCWISNWSGSGELGKATVNPIPGKSATPWLRPRLGRGQDPDLWLSPKSGRGVLPVPLEHTHPWISAQSGRGGPTSLRQRPISAPVLCAGSTLRCR